MEDLKKYIDKANADPRDIKEATVEVGDLTNTMNKNFPNEFTKAIEDGRKKYPGDFFIVAHMYRNQLTQKPNGLLITRQTCEAPT